LARLVGLPDWTAFFVKQKLLVLELWGMGDLIIASPFLQAASRLFQVTLVAKPFARDLQSRFWPDVELVPFTAPWTAFRGKYRLFSWPWSQLFDFRRHLATRHFDLGVSARWDPRDHFVLMVARTRRRFGFPRLRSDIFLTDSVALPANPAHKYENWRIIAQSLGFDLPTREKIVLRPPPSSQGHILVHTGAAQPARVWPLERYRGIVARLRAKGFKVQVVCDPPQREWWLRAQEAQLATPDTVSELCNLVDGASAFIGNDSGPGHLAALSGIPTFTVFGPSLPEWFAPLHPDAAWIPGKPCPYKPCSDYCRFKAPSCILSTSEEEVWGNLWNFLEKRGISLSHGFRNLP
jgi:ADP-heptose:LPS heptosyltransferase